jgi:protoheme ferro-lyase
VDVAAISTLPACGCRTVVVTTAPSGSSHLGVLFDLDIIVRNRARALGLRYVRSASLNTAPDFVRALMTVVRAAVYHHKTRERDDKS